MTDEVLTSEHDPRRGRRQRRLWLAIVLLLILLFFTCSLLQLLLPTPRSTLGKSADTGLTSIFGVYGLHQPLGVAAGPAGEIAVCDTGVQKVLLFDDEGEFVRRIGGDSARDKVYSVDGVMFSEDGLLVCDWGFRKVWVFGIDGTPKRSFPQDPTLEEFGPDGLVPYDVAALGDAYLVSSRDGIYGFSRTEGTSLGRFDDASEAGPLLFANGLTADEERGRVYVCDTLHRRVVAYSSDGRALWSLGRQDVDGRAVSFFGLPRGIGVTDKGILVSDTFKHRLYLLDHDGGLIGWYGQRGVTDARLNFPGAIDVAPDGLIYLADRENNRIQVLRLEEPLPPDSDMQRTWESDHVVYEQR